MCALQPHSNHLQGGILLKNSREKGGKAEIARGADWIRGTFGFDVTESCQRSDNASSRDVILRNGRMRGTLGEVGEAYATRPAAESCELSFAGDRKSVV